MNDRQGISFRWGIPELDHGNVLIPEPIYRFHGQIGIKGNRFVLIMQLAACKYESKGSVAKPSLTTLAQRMGITKRHIIRIIQKLEEEGWLKIKRTISEHGDPERNEYNFEPFSRACWELYTGGSDLHVTTPSDLCVTTLVTPVSPPRKEEEPKKKKSKNKQPSASKPRFDAKWYEQNVADYQEIKGVELSGDHEFGEIQQTLKTIYKAGHTPEDVRALMKAFETSKEEWTANWTIHTVARKLPEFLGGKLFGKSCELPPDPKTAALEEDIYQVDRAIIAIQRKLDAYGLIEDGTRRHKPRELTIDEEEKRAQLHNTLTEKEEERARLVGELGK